MFCFCTQWLKKTRRKALFVSLEKIKEGVCLIFTPLIAAANVLISFVDYIIYMCMLLRVEAFSIPCWWVMSCLVCLFRVFLSLLVVHCCVLRVRRLTMVRKVKRC